MPLTVVGGLPAVGKTAVCREVLSLRAQARPQSRPPTWQEITHRDYAPWPEADLRLDTARLTAAEAARAVIDLGLADGVR